MKKERKHELTMYLKAALESLNREEEDLTKRAKEVYDARIELMRVWRDLDLGPAPGGPAEGWQEVETELADPEILKQLMREGMGITQRIRLILEHNEGRELSAKDVRDMLVRTGFEVEGRSNPLAEVHQILKRIANKPKSGVAKRETPEGTLYKCVGSRPFWAVGARKVKP